MKIIEKNTNRHHPKVSQVFTDDQAGSVTAPTCGNLCYQSCDGDGVVSGGGGGGGGGDGDGVVSVPNPRPRLPGVQPSISGAERKLIGMSGRGRLGHR